MKRRLDFLNTIHIAVGPEDDTNDFYVPKNVVIARSPFLTDAVQEQGQPIRLPDDESRVFSIWLQCLYNNEVVVSDEEDSLPDETWSLLAKTYILAEKLRDIVSANLIITDIIKRLRGSTSLDEAIGEAIQLIYDNRTRADSKLRKAFVDFTVYTVIRSPVLRTMPREFLAEVVAEFTLWRETQKATTGFAFGRMRFGEDSRLYHLRASASPPVALKREPS